MTVKSIRALPLSFGWRWIGRVRNRDFVQPLACEDWFPGKRLYQVATNRAQDWEPYRTVRNNPLTCRLALIKNPPTGRKCRYASGKERELVCAGRKTRCEISVITLARRVMAQPALRRKLRDPWRSLHEL